MEKIFKTWHTWIIFHIVANKKQKMPYRRRSVREEGAGGGRGADIKEMTKSNHEHSFLRRQDDKSVA